MLLLLILTANRVQPDSAGEDGSVYVQVTILSRLKSWHQRRWNDTTEFFIRITSCRFSSTVAMDYTI